MGSCSSSSGTKSESDEHINHYSNLEAHIIDDENGVKIITHLAENDVDSSKNINKLVDQILPAVRSFLMKSSIQENLDIIRLQDIARDETYWISILTRLINKIELNDPLGPLIISLFLEETPLPSMEQINSLLIKISIQEKQYSEKIIRNIFIILSCLSEKCAGRLLLSIISTRKIINFIILIKIN
jgi:hypothetical protein